MSSSVSAIDARFESQREDGESSSVKGSSHDHHTRYSSEDLFASPERNRTGPILPPPEGVALRDWRRQNAIRLEEKEKREKEILNEIIEEAEEYKAEFYRKWKVRVENNKAKNREKEKLLLENQEKFHAEASKNYWKAAAEMIPREVPTIEKKGKKKEPSIVVMHGPKPGKPTDLSRMRQVFLKLKHKPPPHMIPTPSTTSSPAEDGKASASSSASSAPPVPKSVTAE